ncbi:MAG TPA: PAS domain S-box protein, partial [bacterium]|nr:PAS domain S-box protein [bacterium]
FFNAGFAAKNFYDNILEMVKLHGYWNGELCNRRANGELFWERATFSLIKDEHNNISEIIKTSEDITLYKLSEENYIKNIHATKNYIEKIVDAMADALIVITPKNKIKHINSALMKLVGYSQNELLGENVNKIFLDLEINDNLKKSIKVAKISELKTILKSKANELIPVSVNFSFLQYEDDYDNFDIIFLCRDIREQIRTHEIIELSEKRFEIAIKTGNMAFYEYTLYNSKIEWSNSIDSLLKYDVGEFPRTLDEKFKIIYPEDLEFIKQKFERHLYENCEYENVEYRIYNKNNELRWWLESIYTVRDIENQPVKVIGIIHDITNRKETELKLSKSLNELENIHKALLEKDAKLEEINNLLLKQKEEIDYRFNTLAQNLDIGLFRVNLADRKLVYFNQGFLNIFGYSAEEIVNIDRDNFYFNSNDRIKLVEDLKKNGIVKDRIIEFKQKGGKKIIGQTTLKLNDNEPNFFDGIIYDITEKFELIKRLDETLDRYAALFENVNIGLLLLSTNGIIIDANDYVINLFQLKKSDIYGIFFNDLIKYESEKINFEELENAEKKIYENIIVEVNDNLINLQIELKRIIIAEVVFLLMTIKDITELIKLEQEKNNNQIMLIQSSKLAALGELAAGIAHEINQPLAGISMGLENLINKAKLKQINEDYVENKCKTLLSYIDRIKHIIQHIRIYSREQSTQMDKKFNILSPILNSLSMVGTQYINHNILIERDFDETAEIFIIGNEFKLEQVILNLLSNARDAVEDKFEKLKSSGQLGSYRKKIKISVYTKNDDVYLSIEDNGCGIKKENIEKIFNAFFTTKPEGKGTGLGLAIVQSIVKEMNAILLVDSCENEWTRFTIQIKISR